MGSSKSVTFLMVMIISLAAFKLNAQVQSSSSMVDSLRCDKIFEAIDQNQDSGQIKQLCGSRINFSIQNSFRMNVLEYSFYRKNMPTFWYFINTLDEEKADSIITGSMVLPMCIANGDTSMTRVLFNRFKNNFSPKNKVSYYEAFVEFCILYKHANTIRSGVDMDDNYFANTIDLDIKMAELFYEFGFTFREVNEKKQTILFPCCHLEEIEQYFISKGVDINMTDKYGKTFLEYFVEDLAVSIRDAHPNTDWGDEIVDFYKDKLRLLDYYVKHGAKIGKGRVDGWKYINKLAKKNKNKDLELAIKDEYPQYFIDK